MRTREFRCDRKTRPSALFYAKLKAHLSVEALFLSDTVLLHSNQLQTLNTTAPLEIVAHCECVTSQRMSTLEATRRLGRSNRQLAMEVGENPFLARVPKGPEGPSRATG